MPKARARIPIYVEGPDGRPLAGAAVYIRTDPGGADATIYAARTGGATIPNPQTSDAAGRVAGYLERGDYAATVTRPLMDPYVEAFEAAPGAADGVDADWVDDDATGTGLLATRNADGSISWAQATSAGIGDGQVTLAKLAASLSNSLLKLDDSVAGDRRLKWGSADAQSVDFAGGFGSGTLFNNLRIAHGEASAPVWYIGWADTGSSTGSATDPIVCSRGDGGADATYMRFSIRTSTGGTINFPGIGIHWAAIF